MIGFIGAGNMAEAIIRGVVQAGLVSADSIIVSDVRTERLDFLKKELSIQTTSHNKVVVSMAKTLIFAVKPHNVEEVLRGLRDEVTDEHLCISIAAGIKTRFLEESIRCDALRVVRVMPNTPALIQCGASALCKGEHATDEDIEFAQSIFNSVGISVIVEEDLIDAVTGLSGSGPAYIFLIAEVLIKVGIELGMSEEVSEKLSKQMIVGAARMLNESGKTPEELRKSVASPGGTTEAALKLMSSRDFSAILSDAVKRATERSKELGE